MTKAKRDASRRSRLRRKSATLHDANAYTAQDPVLEEEKNPSKFDTVVHDEDLEFNSQKDDEEIDEDLAFTAEDAKQFAHLFGDPQAEETPLVSDVIQTVHHADEVDELFGTDEELEELSDSEGEDAEIDSEKLLEVALGTQPARKTPAVVQTEARPEGIMNLVAEEEESIQMSVARPRTRFGDCSGKGWKVADLSKGVGATQSVLKNVHKSLESLERQDALSAPLPKRIQDRQTRKAGYDSAVKDLSKWDDLVYANRMAPTLEFASPGTSLRRPRTLEDMVDGFEPETQMEREIAEILQSSGGTSEEHIIQMEDAHALKSMSVEKLKKRRGQLAKMRSLLFHYEIKARHVKKIKSKEYHRRLQRAVRKKAVKFGGLSSEAAAKKLLEEMAYNRTKERLTLKHSTMNRFARRIMRRGWGVADEQTKQALEEQLRQSQELKQKMKSAEESSTDEESLGESDEEGGSGFKRTRKELLKVLDGRADPASVPKKGVMGLPFMQKAMQKQKAAAQSDAARMLHQIDGTHDDAEKQTAARMQFGGQSSKSDLVSSSDSEEDGAQRVATKLKMLAKQNMRNLGPLQNESSEQVQPMSKAGTAEENDVTGSRQPEPSSQRGLSGDVTVGISQSELIRMAFADDDVHDEFQQEKEAEVSQELPKLEEASLLPGWGRWKDEQQEPKWMQEQRQKNQRIREKALRKRKDAKKPFVFISEKPNEKMDSYKISRIPPGFASAEAFRASIRRPIGPDFNTAAAFEDFVRPRVLKRKGVIIEPLKLTQDAKDIREHVKEVKAGTVKLRKIVGGEVDGQVQLTTT